MRAQSFSSIMTYKKCPASYNYKYNLGMIDDRPPGPAAVRGTRIHNSIEEHYLADQPLDDDIPAAILPHITAHKGRCEDIRPEMKFALDSNFKPCEYDAEEAYVRGFMDNVFVYPDQLVVHEYKTGQIYDEHDQQKALYGLTMLCYFPEYETVRVEGIYIDKKKVVPSTFNRLQLPGMKMMWKRDIDKMDLPIYPARPGMHCRWCPASKKVGGPCQVG